MSRIRVLSVAMAATLLAGCAGGLPRREPVKPLDLQRADLVFHHGTGEEAPKPFAVKPIANLWRFYPARVTLGDVAVQGDRVWVAGGALHLFDRNTGEWVQTFTPADGLPGSFIRSLLLDGDRLWVNSTEGIGWIETEAAEIGRKEVGGVLEMAAAGDSIFFRTGQGVMRYDKTNDTWDPGVWSSGPGSMSESTAIRTMAVRGDEVWVASRTHLARFDPGTAEWRWTKLSPLEGSDQEHRVVGGICVSDAAVWLWYRGFWTYEEAGGREAAARSWRGLARGSGVIRFGKAAAKTRVYTIKDGLASSVVERIIAVDGAVWALCLPETDEQNTRFIEGGLSRYDPETDRWISYPEINGKPARHVTCAAATDGTLWAAFPAYSSVVTSWMERRLTYRPTSHPSLVRVRGVIVARFNAEEDTWDTCERAADAEPVGLLKAGQVVLVTTGSPLGGRPISDRHISGAVVYALDLRGGEWRQLGRRDTRFLRPVRAVQANDGSIWVVEGNGIRRLGRDAGEESPVMVPSHAVPGIPTAVAVAQGSVWATLADGTDFGERESGRLARRDARGKWSLVRPDPNLPKRVWAMDADDAGNLWVVSVRVPGKVDEELRSLPAQPKDWKGPWTLEVARFDGRKWEKWSWKHAQTPPDSDTSKSFSEDPPPLRIWYRLVATSDSQWIIGSGIRGVLQLRAGRWVVHGAGDLPDNAWWLRMGWWRPPERFAAAFTLYRGSPVMRTNSGIVAYDDAAGRWQQVASFEQRVYGVVAAGDRLLVRERDSLVVIPPEGRRRTIAAGALRHANTVGRWPSRVGEPPALTAMIRRHGPVHPAGWPMAADSENAWLGTPGALVRVNLETGQYLALSSLAGLPLYPQQIVVDGSTTWILGREGIAALDTAKLPAIPKKR